MADDVIQVEQAMTFELWLTFVLAYTVISIIPGPSVMMVTGQALSHGMRAAAFCILGELIGGLCIIALSLLGVGAILAASASLFQAVKWAGVLYMAWLGWRQLRGAHKAPHLSEPRQDIARSSLRAGFLTAILNPKALIFYVAFLSQFLNPEADLLGQYLLVAASSSVIVAGVLGAYALLAARLRQGFQSPLARRRFDQAGGSCLLGGSLYMAVAR